MYSSAPLPLQRMCSCNLVVLDGVHDQQIPGTWGLWVLVVTHAEVPHMPSWPSDLGNPSLASHGHSNTDPVRQKSLLQDFVFLM